jgi:hypothetical protein
MVVPLPASDPVGAAYPLYKTAGSELANFYAAQEKRLIHAKDVVLESGYHCQ